MADKPKAVAVEVESTNPLKRLWVYITKKKNPKDVNTDKNPRNYLTKPRRFWLFNFITLCVLIVIGLTAKIYIDKKNTAFTIDGIRYSIKDLNNVFKRSQNKDIDKKDIKNTYIELEKIKLAAKKIRITVDSNVLDTTTKQNFQETSFNDTSIIKQKFAYELALAEQLHRSYVGDYVGYLYVFPFGNKIPQESADPIIGAGDKTAIESDKQYAQQKVNYYYDQLKSGKMDNDKVIKEIMADRRFMYTNSTNDSVKFESTNQNPWETTIRSSTAITMIKGLTKVGLSDIKTSQVRNTQTKAMEDDGYYFIDLKNLGIARQDIIQLYEKTLKALKVKIYVQ